MPTVCRDFYPRSPCGERPANTAKEALQKVFLSTLSLRRATPPVTRRAQNLSNFYPRSPCGERPEGPAKLPKQIRISIHALLAESDRGWTLNINGPIFLSTLSLRRATVVNNIIFVPGKFLSTLSLRRATNINSRTDNVKRFLSTLSLRRATTQAMTNWHYYSISIHALLAESDG